MDMIGCGGRFGLLIQTVLNNLDGEGSIYDDITSDLKDIRGLSERKGNNGFNDDRLVSLNLPYAPLTVVILRPSQSGTGNANK